MRTNLKKTGYQTEIEQELLTKGRRSLSKDPKKKSGEDPNVIDILSESMSSSMDEEDQDFFIKEKKPQNISMLQQSKEDRL